MFTVISSNLIRLCLKTRSSEKGWGESSVSKMLAGEIEGPESISSTHIKECAQW